jgi:3-oxoacyl-(acyl-carrier-protein) synthase
VTGLGVLAPNGHGVDAFEHALREGKSGIRFVPKMKELNFGCQVAGIPENVQETAARYFPPSLVSNMNEHTTMAAIAAVDCWTDAGFEIPDPKDGPVDGDTGLTLGTGMGSPEMADLFLPLVASGNIRRLGSSMAERTMCSSAAARVSGLLGIGGEVTMNSNACATGTQSLLDGWQKIRSSYLQRVLVGAAEGSSCYNWAPFDAIRVLARNYNHAPERASRPMSASANGFVPASGAGMMLLESLDSALARNAKIYAEVLGGFQNCGAQRNGGSMTLANASRAQLCIQRSLCVAGVKGSEVDLVNGHLTSTAGDVLEVKNLLAALDLPAERFPFINSTLSLTGHSLGAAGTLSSIAAVVQLHKGFVHGSVNCDDLHPELSEIAASIPHSTLERDIRVLMKTSFGFGDVNASVLFRKWTC